MLPIIILDLEQLKYYPRARPYCTFTMYSLIFPLSSRMSSEGEIGTKSGFTVPRIGLQVALGTARLFHVGPVGGDRIW